MSIARMKRVRLLALISDRDRILHDLLMMGCMEITQPDSVSPELMGIVKRDESLYAQMNANRNRIASAIRTLKRFAHVKKKLLQPRPALSENAFFSQEALSKALKTAKGIESLDKELSSLLAEAGRLENRRVSLLPWRDLDAPLDTEGYEDCPVLLGVCPAAADMEALGKKLDDTDGACALRLIGSDRDQHYLMLVCHRSVFPDAMETLKGAGFSRVQFKDVSGTASENLALIETGLSENREKQAGVAERLSAMGPELALLEHAYDILGAFMGVQASRERLLNTGSVFYMEGWVPEKRRPDVEKMLSGYVSAFELSDPREGDNVPVKLDNGALVAPMSMVTEMYSLPDYRGVDPNPLIFPFFPVFFGIMYADIAYGLILCAISMIVLYKAKPHGATEQMFKLMGICGVTTVVFGALFGGFFGDVVTVVGKSFFHADVSIPPLLFNPLENPMQMLYLALALGVVQIVTGMLVKACMLIRDGRPWDALMDVGSWFLLFGGFTSLYFTGSYFLTLAGAAALVLTQGRHGKNVFSKLLGGLASLYNVTSYLSDVLSYLRLMALCLATTVIASVVNTLGAMAGVVGFFIVFLVGHAFNMGINIIGTYVHAARLQYLEYFSKFYISGGKPFQPLGINTKYVDVLKGEQ